MRSLLVHLASASVAFKPERTQRSLVMAAAFMALISLCTEAMPRVGSPQEPTVPVLSHAAPEPVFCLLGWDERRRCSRAPSGERLSCIATQPAREVTGHNQGATGKNNRREPEKVVDVDQPSLRPREKLKTLALLIVT
jgi:hypothetical protein